MRDSHDGEIKETREIEVKSLTEYYTITKYYDKDGRLMQETKRLYDTDPVLVAYLKFIEKSFGAQPERS